MDKLTVEMCVNDLNSIKVTADGVIKELDKFIFGHNEDISDIRYLIAKVDTDLGEVDRTKIRRLYEKHKKTLKQRIYFELKKDIDRCDKDRNSKFIIILQYMFYIKQFFTVRDTLEFTKKVCSKLGFDNEFKDGIEV